MSPLVAAQKISILGLFAVLAACGGSPGGSTQTASSSAPASSPTTLAVSSSSLALMVNGAARSVTVVNTGAHPAESVEVVPGAAFPAGTIYLNSCGTLAPGASCVVTITPGAVPSATPGVTAPSPVALSIAGANTNTLVVQTHVLDHGSAYQGGLVFAFDDTTPSSGSVGGKVAAASVGIPAWSHHFAGSINLFTVPGVNETSVGPLPSCDGAVDGACNTQLIVAAPEHAGVPLVNYAAGACQGALLNGYADWYLPAICEMGPVTSVGCPPGIETMQEKLQTPGHASFTDSWSSTQFSAAPTPLAWIYRFASLPGGDAAAMTKNMSGYGASCVRKLSI